MIRHVLQQIGGAITPVARALLRSVSQSDARSAVDVYGTTEIGLMLGSAPRNRIMNGAMVLDQRRAGASYTVNTGSDVYVLDRWFTNGEAASGVYTCQQLSATPPTGFVNYVRLTVTTADTPIPAGAVYAIGQKIEGVNVADLGFGAAGASSVTVSFKFRSSIAGNFSGALRNGASNRAYPFTIAAPNANTWTDISFTIPGDVTGTWEKNSNSGMALLIDVGTGTTNHGPVNAWAAASYVGVTGAVNLIETNGATMDITGVQIEKGSVATPFEHLAFPLLLLQCQRYYEKTFPLGLAPAQNAGFDNAMLVWGQVNSVSCGGDWWFKATKRADPTIVTFNPAAANANFRDASTPADRTVAIDGNSNDAKCGMFMGTGVPAANTANYIHITADAEL